VKLSNIFFLVVVATIAAIVAIANRQVVTFSLDPLSQAYPSVAFTLPLYLLVFFSILFGVLLGGASVGLRRRRRRRALTLPPVADEPLVTAEPRSTREAVSPHVS
jgi:uncharacterized integral membrane protein